MTKLEYIIGAIISALALGLGTLRFFKPIYPIDSTTLGLLGLTVLPWLPLFFKKFKIPGIVEGESHDRAQGVTPPVPAKVLPPPGGDFPTPGIPIVFNGLGASAKKVLRTLGGIRNNNSRVTMIAGGRSRSFRTRWNFRSTSKAWLNS